MDGNTVIRLAREEDAAAAAGAAAGAIAALSGQLGYPASKEEMARRLQALAADEAHAVYVAQDADGQERSGGALGSV
jgi:hypothetical protein